jgi:hypothetical protein
MPLTLLDWRRSHHQAIGPIRDRVIPTLAGCPSTAQEARGTFAAAQGTCLRPITRCAQATIVPLDIAVCYFSDLDDLAVAQGWISRARSAAALSGEEQLNGWNLRPRAEAAAFAATSQAEPGGDQIAVGR